MGRPPGSHRKELGLYPGPGVGSWGLAGTSLGGQASQRLLLTILCMRLVHMGGS